MHVNTLKKKNCVGAQDNSDARRQLRGARTMEAAAQLIEDQPGDAAEVR